MPWGLSRGIELFWVKAVCFAGKYDQAIADFNKAVGLDPSSANYYNWGLTYAEKGEYDKAIADLEICITLSRDPSLTEEAKQIMEELQAQD